jgi:antitoxin MazE
MKVAIRRIGNSSGVILPQPMLLVAGIHEEAEMAVEKGMIVLRKPRKGPRAGWDDAARELVAAGEGAFLWPECR